MLRFPLFLELWNHLWRPHHGDADPAVKIPLLLEDLWRLMTHTNHVTYRHQLILRSHFVAGKCSRFNICQKMEGGKYGQLMCNLHLEDKTHVIPDISLRVHTRQQSMEFPATTSLLRFFTKKRLWSFRQYQQHHGSIPCIWKGPYIDAECIRHPELLLPRVPHVKCCFKRWCQKRKHHDTVMIREFSDLWCDVEMYIIYYYTNKLMKITVILQSMHVFLRRVISEPNSFSLKYFKNEILYLQVWSSLISRLSSSNTLFWRMHRTTPSVLKDSNWFCRESLDFLFFISLRGLFSHAELSTSLAKTRKVCVVIGTSHMYFCTRITWKWRGLLALGKVQIRNFTNFQLHELHSNTVSLGEGFSDPSTNDLLVFCVIDASHPDPQNQFGQNKKLRLAQANVDERYPPQSNLPIFLASNKNVPKTQRPNRPTAVPLPRRRLYIHHLRGQGWQPIYGRTTCWTCKKKQFTSI